MYRCLVVTSLFGACGFSATSNGASPPDGIAVDSAPSDTTLDVPFCDPTDAKLVGCWELEGNGHDASGDGNDATMTSVAYQSGVTGMAAVLTAASDLHIGARASLGPPHLSLEAWINATTLPAAGNRTGVFDNDSAYGLFYTASTVTCAGNTALTATTTLPMGTWTHLACTFDGSVLALYIDGTSVATLISVGALGPGNTQGAVLGGNAPTGDRMVGLLDQVRVFSEPRTPAQICAAAGKQNCP